MHLKRPGSGLSTGTHPEKMSANDLSRERRDNDVIRPACLRFVRSTKVFKTFCLYVACIAWGMCATLLGTTIVHMELLFDTNTATMSWTLTAYALGYLLGAVICGLIYDRLNHELTFCVANFVSAGSLMIAPFVGSVWPFAVVMSVQGVSQGFMDASAQSYTVSLWDGHRLKEPTVMLAHAAWSLGAAIGPLIIGAFLVELPPASDVTEWPSLLSATSSSPNETDTDLAVYGIASNGLFRSQADYGTFSSISPLNYNLQKDIALPSDVGNVRFAYVVIGSLVLSAGLLFMVSYFRGPTECALAQGSRIGSAERSGEGPMSAGRAGRSLVRFLTGILFLFLLFTFYHVFAYVELPKAYFTTFAIKYLHWPVQHASLVMSVFFGSHCLGRVIGVPLSAVLRPRTMLLINTTLTAVAHVMLLALVEVWPNIFWVSAALAGGFIATTFAAGVLWVSETIPVSGRVASVILIGTSTGSMIGPLVVGQLFESVGPMCLVYVLVAMSLGHIALYVTMLLFVDRCRHRLRRLEVDVRQGDGKEMTSLAASGDDDGK